MVRSNSPMQPEAQRYSDERHPTRQQVARLLRQRYQPPYRRLLLGCAIGLLWVTGALKIALWPNLAGLDEHMSVYQRLTTALLSWLHLFLWPQTQNWNWLHWQPEPLFIWWGICFGTLGLLWMAWAVYMGRPAPPHQALRWQQERAAISRGQLTQKEALKQLTFQGSGLPLAQLAKPSLLSQPQSVFLGVARQQLEGHALVLAPTRSGKSMHLTETLLSYDRAMVIVDPKSEQYQRTAGYRARHVGPVYHIPGNTLDLAHYFNLLNPVDVLALHRHMMQPWKDGKNRAFADKAKHLFEASARYAAEHQLHPIQVLFDVARSVPQTALTTLATVDLENVYSFTNGQPPDEGLDRYAASAWGVFHDRFYPYQDHWWTLSQQSNLTGIPVDWAEQRATIYITWPMTQLADVAGAIESIIAALLRDKISRNNKTPAIIAIDEMPHIGIEELPTWLAQVGGYGITLLLYAQTWSQLVEVYGIHRANTITSNCQYQLWYPSADLGTAQHMSQLYGGQLSPYRNYGESRSRDRLEIDAGKRGRSQGLHVQREPSLDARQMMSLPQETVLLQMGRQHVTLAQRLWPVAKFASLPPVPPIVLATTPARPKPTWAPTSNAQPSSAPANHSPHPTSEADYRRHHHSV